MTYISAHVSTVPTLINHRNKSSFRPPGWIYKPHIRNQDVVLLFLEDSGSSRRLHGGEQKQNPAPTGGRAGQFRRAAVHTPVCASTGV